MKVKISRKGLYDEKGKKVEVGTTIDLGSSVKELPGALVNKCVVQEEAAEVAEVEASTEASTTTVKATATTTAAKK